MGRGSNKEGTKEEEARSIGTTYVGQKSVQERVDARVGLALDIDNEPVLRERTGLWRDPETTDNGWLGGGRTGSVGLRWWLSDSWLRMKEVRKLILACSSVVVSGMKKPNQTCVVLSCRECVCVCVSNVRCVCRAVRTEELGVRGEMLGR